MRTLVVSLALASLALTQDRPPATPEATRKPELVELVKLDPTIKLDIRYAGTNNFLGKPVYKEARAFLQRPAAEALLRAHHDAVDLTLYELATGRAVQMPGDYDEMTERSYPDYTGGTAEQRARRDLLRKAMASHGFTVETFRSAQLSN